MIKVNC